MQSGIAPDNPYARAHAQQQQGAAAKEAAHQSGADEEASQREREGSARLEQQRGENGLDAEHADGDERDAKPERKHDRRDEQRQQEDDVDEGKAGQGDRRRQHVRHAPMRFETAQTRLGAQLAGDPCRITERRRDLRFAAARGIGEMGGIVANNILDLPRRQAGKSLSQRAQEGVPGHGKSSRSLSTAPAKERQSRRWASKACWPSGVSR
ncbi:mlr2485 [Mesorhizobium japonicum MAFF 303099]|uniref:Mlr2485 protein n=1 Tax=Mesorhizobium japonicum (strain LMG 29417 / CECT 9101 / MAFF 303099) TaxID=266835 RepID=Q98IB0_RHILO|nr:mlr2485 [Mesorhizobium japonicum MAFF 303099]